MDTQTNTPAETDASCPKFPARIIAVGQAGINLLMEVVPARVPGEAAAAIDLDASSLGTNFCARKTHLQCPSQRGLSGSGDPERGRVAAEDHFADLKGLCEGNPVIVIVAGLGGAAGSGISPVLARAARESGALTLAIVMLPFACEGNLRGRVADVALAQLREAADVVITIPNEKTLALLDEKVSLIDTFKPANEFASHSLATIWTALSGKNAMGLPFTDLCWATRSVCSLYDVVSAEASGPNRASELLEKLMTHPMIGGAHPFSDAGSVAVCVQGGPSLTMAEVNRLMQQAQEKASSIPLLMGTVIDPALADSLRVLLLVGRTGGRGEEPAALPNSSRVPGNPDTQLVRQPAASPGCSRFIAPAPSLTPDQMQEIRSRQTGGRSRKTGSRLRQTQLPLEIVSRGRFEKSEPTIHKGEDLDVPTYIRRGVSLN